MHTQHSTSRRIAFQKNNGENFGPWIFTTPVERRAKSKRPRATLTPRAAIMSSANAGGGGGEGCCQTCWSCVTTCCTNAWNADHDTAARYMRITNFLNAVLLIACGIVYLVNPTSWARASHSHSPALPRAPRRPRAAAGHGRVFCGRGAGHPPLLLLRLLPAARHTACHVPLHARRASHTPSLPRLLAPGRRLAST